MYPELIRLGPITLHTYGLFMALGFLSALGVWVRLGRVDGYTPEILSSLLLRLLIAGLLGARLYYVIEHLPFFLEKPFEIIRIDRGGLMFYGGVLGAGAGLILFARHHRRPLPDVLDLTLVALPLGHAFGRLGCLMNGCCFGRPSSAFWGIRFPRGSLAWIEHRQDGLLAVNAVRSLPVAPTQWLEIVGNLLIFSILFHLYPRRKFPGMIAGLYLLLYPVLRIAVEPLRGDARLTFAAGSIGQWISVALMVLGFVILLNGQRSRRRPAPLETNPAGVPPNIL